MPRILTHIVEQHAEEAAFLWLLRDKAVDAPHYKRHHLARLDERVEAHVDGLRVAGEAGREIAWSQLQRWGEMGELFAAAVTLVETGDPELVAPCVDFAEEHPESLRGLVGAIAWTAPECLGQLVRIWLDSARPLERYLGVAACSVHRVDPYSRLARLLVDNEAQIRARALRLVGELGRADLADTLLRVVDEDADSAARFWASWSLALRSDSPRAVVELQKLALSQAPEARTAFDLALRAMPIDDARAWLSGLSRDADRARQVAAGLGVIGDPAAVPWLIARMQDPSLARTAGESLSLITGVNLSDHDLDREAPESLGAVMSEELADADASIDPDDRLPWPAAGRVAAWWEKESGRFVGGHRHLLGATIELKACDRAWADGYQRQRRAAAFELARLQPGAGLRNWRGRVARIDSNAALAER